MSCAKIEVAGDADATRRLARLAHPDLRVLRIPLDGGEDCAILLPTVVTSEDVDQIVRNLIDWRPPLTGGEAEEDVDRGSFTPAMTAR
jgi:hypothetical protein